MKELPSPTIWILEFNRTEHSRKSTIQLSRAFEEFSSGQHPCNRRSQGHRDGNADRH